jgi:hypothetical protein
MKINYELSYCVRIAYQYREYTPEKARPPVHLPPNVDGPDKTACDRQWGRAEIVIAAARLICREGTPMGEDEMEWNGKFVLYYKACR